ncbi:phosphopantothenoylcysteine decarboxylase isoform X2 [Ailuropoda melanoleuca]|uniref:phosphopantothenoylcysteine decarboxylase isoform X2 n=1 Tax=Ailuropoda melanoleuca TaxID=9646 RepID=UPI000947FAC0|nr:phosphopantothenoylcysteine decarboxylase isoform X2 [Ailuropoda melanoleuca]
MESSAPCPAAAPLVKRQFHVLVGVTGSVAALKLPLLVSRLLDIPDLEVAVVTTERAKHFYSPQDVPVTLYSDADEWEMWRCRSDPVLHIDLRRWADLMLVAPLDANTLGKTCVIRAWDCRKPLLFCPAMNTVMWEHPITAQQVGQLKAFGYVEIPCVAKKLVCGDQGIRPTGPLAPRTSRLSEALRRGFVRARGRLGAPSLLHSRKRAGSGRAAPARGHDAATRRVWGSPLGARVGYRLR